MVHPTSNYPRPKWHALSMVHGRHRRHRTNPIRNVFWKHRSNSLHSLGNNGSIHFWFNTTTTRIVKKPNSAHGWKKRFFPAYFFTSIRNHKSISSSMWSKTMDNIYFRPSFCLPPLLWSMPASNYTIRSSLNQWKWINPYSPSATCRIWLKSRACSSMVKRHRPNWTPSQTKRWNNANCYTKPSVKLWSAIWKQRW